MREFLQRWLSQISSFWEGRTLPWKLGISAGALAIVLLVMFLIFAPRGEYVTLYGGLTPEDISSIASALREQRIDYQIRESEVLVKVEAVDRSRRVSAERGRLSSGVRMFGTKTLRREGDRGYKILERGALSMASDTEFRELQRQALEGELAFTLRTFTGVFEVDVKLSLPKPEPFVRDQEEPKASVTLELAPQDLMDGLFDVNTIKSMQRLVAHSTPGLKPENVHIVDTTGTYDSEELVKRKTTPTDWSLEFLEAKKRWEEAYTRKLENAVKPLYGDKVHIAGVEVELDLKERTRVSEEFWPVTEDGTGLARSEMTERESFEGEGTIPGGEPGTNSNLFPPEYEAYQSTGLSTYDRNKTIRNYEMNRSTTEEKAMPKITVKSAAVWIDFSIESQISSIREIVKSTLDITTDQIAIETWQAPVKQVQEVLSKAQPVWIELGQMIVIALVVIAILLFLRSLVSKHDVKEVVPEAYPTENLVPEGFTVQEYVDRLVGERMAYVEREREEMGEQKRIEQEEEMLDEGRAKQQEDEEEARQQAVEMEKRAQEEEVLREEAETQRRNEVLEQISNFAGSDPETTAALLGDWLAEDSATEDSATREK